MQAEWQTIDTAPKDGSVIHISQGRNVVSAYWSQCAEAFGGDEEFPWVFLDPTNGTNGYMGGRFGPTHWMPLPPPPLDTQESTDR